MPTRSSLLLASAACLFAAAPLQAGDDRYAGVDYPAEEAMEEEWVETESWRGMWSGFYTDRIGARVEGNYRGTFEGDSLFVGDNGLILSYDRELGWREEADATWEAGDAVAGGYETTPYYAASGRPLGYSLAERNAWLADCRALYLGDADHLYADYDEDDDDGNGGIIGGLLGAVAGGIVGNRVADGERLGGTLIGAGVGGLAGLLIGLAIDAAGDGDDDYGHDYDEYDAQRVAEYCEAYLRRYEAGASMGGYAPGYAPGYAVVMQPQQVVTMRPTAIREVVTEEWVEVEAERPARRTMPRRSAAPQATKLEPLK